MIEPRLSQPKATPGWLVGLWGLFLLLPGLSSTAQDVMTLELTSDAVVEGETAEFAIYFQDVVGTLVDTGSVAPGGDTVVFASFSISLSIPNATADSGAAFQVAGVTSNASQSTDLSSGSSFIWFAHDFTGSNVILGAPAPGQLIANLEMNINAGTGGQPLEIIVSQTGTYARSLQEEIESLENQELTFIVPSLTIQSSGQPQPPSIAAFAADPTSIEYGDASELSWQISGANSATIDQGVGPVDAVSGTRSVSPTESTTYTLTATNAEGDSSRSVTVTVLAPTIASFSADPSSIGAGESSTLSWDVTGAASVEISPGVGTVAASGTWQVSPDATTTYTLTATNPSGTRTAQVIVTVDEPQAPTIESFSANPTTVDPGASSTLSWSVTDADTVSIDQGVGTVAASGSTSVSPTQTTVYTLTATNASGTVTAQVTITVSDPQAPTIESFSANPTTLDPGGSSTLTWSVTDADTVSIDQGVGTVAASGSTSVSPTQTTTYTLTASNTLGSVTAQVTVTVNAVDPPSISYFNANPEIISPGGTTILSWEVTGADTVTITPNVGTVNPRGTHPMKPNRTTTYTLTAANAGGQVTRSVTVTVRASSSPVIKSFEANPLSISAGESSTLTWDVENADSVILDGLGGAPEPVDLQGSRIVQPEESTTYTLTATNTNDTVTAEVRVLVDEVRILLFEADKIDVLPGERVELTWDAVHAYKLLLSPPDPPEQVAPHHGGHKLVYPTETTTYTLTAQNYEGDSDQATLTVVVYSADYLMADPTAVDFGLDASKTAFDLSADVNAPVPFEVTNIPEWLSVEPAEGQVGETPQRIQLEVDRSLFFPGQSMLDSVTVRSANSRPLVVPISVSHRQRPIGGGVQFFPDVVVNEEYTSVMTIANAQPDTARLVVQVFNQLGELETHIQGINVSPYGTYRMTLSEMETERGWVAVTGTYGELTFETEDPNPFGGSVVIRSTDGTRLYAFSGIDMAEPRLFVPHLAVDPAFFTQGTVVNMGTNHDALVFSTPMQPDLFMDSYLLGGQDAFDFRKAMGGEILGPGWGELSFENGDLLSGVEAFGRTPETGLSQVVGVGLNGQASTELFFTHIAADVVNFWTGVVIINTENVGTDIWFEPHDAEGNLISGGFSEFFAPKEKRAYLVTGAQIPFGPDAAWVKVTADKQLIGYELFGTFDDRFAGFESIASPRRYLVFPHLEEPERTGAWTGLALINAADAPATLTLSLRSKFGVIKEQVNRNLAPKEKLVSLVSSLFSSTPGVGDTVHVESDQPLAGFELFGYDRDTLAGVLAISVDPVEAD